MAVVERLKVSALSTVPFIIYGLLQVFHLIQSLFSLDQIKFLAHCLLSTSNKDKKDVAIKIPQHLAVSFGNYDLISLPLIYDIIQHASSEGIRRISFFDKTGFIKSKSEEIKDYWSKQISANQVYKSVVFPDKLTPKCPMGLSVHFLDLSDGKEQIVNITKEMTSSSSPITVEAVRSRLEAQGVHEVDFLLSVGCANSLANYPPWALRVAEIQNINSFYTDRLSRHQFINLLRSFAFRDRRMGR